MDMIRTLLFLVALPFFLASQNPSLDLNFATSGHFYHYSNQEYSHASALGIQSDGKLIIGGYEGGSAIFTINGKLFRLLPNGQVDSSFGVNGFVPDTLFPGNWAIWRITIQSDDKIIVVGWSEFSKTSLIARFTSNGNLDQSFNNVGYHLIDFSPGSYSSHTISEVKVLPNNKILMLGDAARMALIQSTKCLAPPSGKSSRSTLVITT